MEELTARIKKNLANEETRYVYADTVVNAFIAAQIKALRDDRDLSQQELASLIGTKQSGVSRLERADYSSWKVETLRKLARAFGVRLRIRFEEFGTLLDEMRGFYNKNLLPRNYRDDPIFNPHTRRRGEGNGLEETGKAVGLSASQPGRLQYINLQDSLQGGSVLPNTISGGATGKPMRNSFENINGSQGAKYSASGA
ncbi:MAG: XRE family transcriptional regulator [Bryobacterales bacterium]|nr:XRE family transcriptional regulator [Bryobacterales bacterium]